MKFGYVNMCMIMWSLKGSIRENVCFWLTNHNDWPKWWHLKLPHFILSNFSCLGVEMGKLLLTFVVCDKHWYKSKCRGAGEGALCLLFSWMKLRMCLAHVEILTNTKSWNISSSSSWSSTKIICKDKWRLSHSLIMTSWFFWSSDMCPLWGAQAWFCFWRLWGLWKKQWMTTTCSIQNLKSSMDGCCRENLSTDASCNSFVIIKNFATAWGNIIKSLWTQVQTPV